MCLPLCLESGRESSKTYLQEPYGKKKKKNPMISLTYKSKQNCLRVTGDSDTAIGEVSEETDIYGPGWPEEVLWRGWHLA